MSAGIPYSSSKASFQAAAPAPPVVTRVPSMSNRMATRDPGIWMAKPTARSLDLVCEASAAPREFEETRDRQGAFPRLGDDALAALEEKGARRAVREGELLFQAGDQTYDFFVVLTGKVAIVQDLGGADEAVIGVHGPGRFLGELNLLTGEGVYLTAQVIEEGEVLQVPRERARALVAGEPGLGDVVLRAFLARRAILIGLGTGPKLVGSRFSPDTRRLRVFLARNRMPHGFIDLEEDEGADALLRELDVEPADTPI